MASSPPICGRENSPMADPPRNPQWPGPGHRDERYLRDIGSLPANDDGPVWLVKLAHDSAPSQETHPSAEYRRSLDELGAETVFFGDVVAQPGNDVPSWSRVGVFKFPSRRSVLHAPPVGGLLHPDAPTAEIDGALVLCCIPSPTMPLPAHLSVPMWSRVPHPASDDDSPVVVVHLIRYASGDWPPEDMAAYAQLLASASVPHGARATRWFAAEGTIVGDGNDWDDVRFTMYPSAAAFHAVLADLADNPDFAHHRARVIADQYTVVVRPSIDHIARSVIH